jgi:putative ABC transport system ATP-binding protein
MMNSYALRLSLLTHAWANQPPLFFIDKLELPQGKHLFIQGPSGCGKSTLLSLLSGVLQVQSGVCEVLGQDMSKLGSVQRDALRGEKIGVIFQQFNLLTYLNVASNALLPTRLFPSRAAAAALEWGSPMNQANSLASALGLNKNLWQQSVHTLSVGQQQRVAAVRALMGAPQLLIADEPTSALDESNQLEFIDLLLKTAERQQASVVMVSHNPRLANRFDQVFHMTSGVTV